MNIRVNQISPVNEEAKSSLLGFASITIDNLFTINNIRLIDSEQGKFVSMPNYKGSDEEYHPYVDIKQEQGKRTENGKEVMKEITKAIFEAYDIVKDGKELPKSELEHDASKENAKKVNIYVYENKFINMIYNDIVLHGSRVREQKENPENLFMTTPSGTPYQDEKGETKYPSIYFVPDAEARKMIQEKAVENYQRFFGKQESQETAKESVQENGKKTTRKTKKEKVVEVSEEVQNSEEDEEER